MRLRSGVPGLDVLIGGGFIRGKVYLITGPPGSGKSVMVKQMIREGLLRGERCAYVSVDVSTEDIRRDFREMGLDVEKFENEGMLAIVDCHSCRLGKESEERLHAKTIEDLDHVFNLLESVASNLKSIDRMVLEDVDSLLGGAGKEESFRFLKKLEELAKRTNAVLLLTATLRIYSENIDRMLKHYASGVIELEMQKDQLGRLRRTLIVEKYPGKHATRRFEYEITSKGILVKV